MQTARSWTHAVVTIRTAATAPCDCDDGLENDPAVVYAPIIEALRETKRKMPDVSLAHPAGSAEAIAVVRGYATWLERKRADEAESPEEKLRREAKAEKRREPSPMRGIGANAPRFRSSYGQRHSWTERYGENVPEGRGGAPDHRRGAQRV